VTTSTQGTGTAQPSIGQLVQEASGHLSTMLHGEIELAKVEIKTSVKNAGAGAGLFAAAGVLLVFALTFGFIALAEGLVALHIWRWAAYLIVFGFLVLVVAIFAFIGMRQVKRVKAPERTIAETKQTAALLRHPSQKTS
jgi:uncharacterized membrane protein YqjE